MNPELDELDKVNRVFEAFERLVCLIDFLRNDTVIAYSDMLQSTTDDPKRAYRRRTYVRTAFAYLEGTCFGMRQICADANDVQGIVKLTPDEMLYVLELPQANGKTKWIRSEDVVKDSFKFCAQVLHRDFKLNLSSPGWMALCQSKIIRDRLAHPKRVQELELSDKEVAETHEGLEWFLAELDRLIVSPLKP
jgi:hypothetical protein